MYDALAKDEFKFSVAKGETVTLSTKYTGSLTGSFSGTVYNAADLGVNFTISCTYEKGTQYSGPSEDSIYNSREFRMKFYHNAGSYTQSRLATTYYYMNPMSSETQTVTGTFTEPTKYLSYSIDKKIS